MKALLVLLAAVIFVSGCVDTGNVQPSGNILTVKLISSENGNFNPGINYYEGTLTFKDTETGLNYTVHICSDDWLWVKENSCYAFDQQKVEQNIESHKYSAALSGCYVGKFTEATCS